MNITNNSKHKKEAMDKLNKFIHSFFDIIPPYVLVLVNLLML